MPPKKTKSRQSDSETMADELNMQSRLCDLLSRLPVDGFVTMASNSGLTTEEIRELCDAFRKLKE